MGRTAAACEAGRKALLASVCVGASALTGCAGWEWTFETNGIGLTESLLKKFGSYISGNSIVHPGGGVGVGIATGGPGVGAGGGGGGGSGGAGGGTGPGPGPGPGPGTADAAQEPEEEDVTPASVRAGERAVVTVAGRAWGVVDSATRIDGEDVVLEALLEARGEGVKGVHGALRVRVPRSAWPDAGEGSADEAAWPARVAPANEPARAKDAPTLPLAWEASREGLELSGVRYDGSLHALRLTVDVDGSGGATVRGTIDMLAQREGGGGTQWVRVRAIGAARAVASGR